MHSKNYAKVKRYYDKGLWTTAMVRIAVRSGWITGTEYTEITGLEY